MLARFEVENFRSILEPVELSLVAAERDRPGVFPMDGHDVALLPVAAVYGPNASGKTNLIAALDWLLDGVRDSLRFWDDGIPIEPFLFGGEARERPTSFLLDYFSNGAHYEYSLEIDSLTVRYEALSARGGGWSSPIFERNELDVSFSSDFSAQAGTRELLTDRSLVLSIARRFKVPGVDDFVQELLWGRSLGLSRRRAAGVHIGGARSPYPGSRVFEGRDPDLRRRALEMLRLADLGVEDVHLDEETRAPRLLHRFQGDLVPLDYDLESQGTRTWVRLLGPVLEALQRGSLLLFDELDASLHPSLSAALLRLFADVEANPRGAQLVFTTHDTSLLDHLNRDEVWLTEKAGGAATSLSALAEFSSTRVQESRDLARGYLAGRFGAIPEIERSALLRALGLVG